MPIQEALNKATQGGYHIHDADGVETAYSGASRAYSAWTRTDNQSSCMAAVEETFLDAYFWQVLRRALRWDHTIATVHTVENGRPTVVTSTGQQWRSHWHRFVDCLADGKTAADFFQSLPEKENPCVSEYSHRCLSGRIGRIGCMDGEAYLQVLTNICHCRSRSWHSKKGKHSWG